MKYTNSKCPICGEMFQDDSDVVVCPECGTPHHRSCYEKHGHCKNSDKHDDGFMWHLPEEFSKTTANINSSTKEDTAKKIYTGSNINKESAPNGTIPGLEIDQDGRAIPVYRAVTPNEKIGNYTVEEYGNVVKKNVHKYMPKFIVMDRTGRKASWNWAAFFFGPAWMIYRKMYKYGIIALVITIILPLIFIGDVVKYQEKYAETWSEMFQVMMSDANMTEKELTDKTDAIATKAPQEPTAMVISSYIQLAVDIVCGIFGNYFYKAYCTKVLDDAKKLNDTDEARKKFIEKKGGPSFASVLVVYAASFVLVTVVIYIYSSTQTDLATILRRYI